jgi:hypothetical protein
MIVNQNGEPMPPLGDYRDSQIATLTRERDALIKEVAEWRSRPDALRADKAEADRDVAIATLTRERDVAEANYGAACLRAAGAEAEFDQLTGRFEDICADRDAAIARAEVAETAFNAVANCAIYRMERDALRALLREAGEKIGPFVKLKPVSWSLEGDHYYVKTVAIRALADLAARITAATQTGDSR